MSHKFFKALSILFVLIILGLLLGVYFKKTNSPTDVGELGITTDFNSEAGIQFEYPSNWAVVNIEDNNFNVKIYRPDLIVGSSSNSYIRMRHNPKFDSDGRLLDGLSLEKQRQYVSCKNFAIDGSICSEHTNKNKVEYIEIDQNSSGLIDRPDEGYSKSVFVPTGKYIITIDTISTEDKGAKIFDMFDRVVNSVKINF